MRSVRTERIILGDSVPRGTRFVKKHATLIRIALAAAVATATLSQIADDQVELQCSPVAPVQCPSGGENGVLLIAKTVARDDIPPSPNSTISVGRVGPAYSQAVAFRSDRAPGIATSLTWTSGPDMVRLQYAALIQVPVQVWVVCPKDPANSQCGAFSNTALDQFLFDANGVLDTERAGIRLSKAQPAAGWLANETANPQLANFLDFVEQDCVAMNQAVSSSQKKRADAVNIYMVRKVSKHATYGHTCPSGNYTIPGRISVVGHKANWKTILHEIGHTLSLGHVTPSQPWDGNRKENYMYSYSSVRKYFTEGQTFRMHFDTRSAVNTLGLRNQSIRNCGDTDDAGENVAPPCPHLGTRIWPDQ